MRNVWVGDKGDFGKYGMIRKVCRLLESSEQYHRLGVVWCYNQDGGHPHRRIFGQGPQDNRIRYLDNSLYDFIQQFVQPNGPPRTVAAVQNRMILPTSTYFGLDQGHTYLSVASRTRARRAEWTRQAIYEMRNVDIVFLDPDTGIAPPKEAENEVEAFLHGRPHRRSEKHLYLDELLRFRNAGKSLIIYQDARRQSIRYRLKWLTRCLEKAHIERNAIRVFHWPDRFFVCIVHPEHDFLHTALNEFKQSPWYENGLFREL